MYYDRKVKYLDYCENGIRVKGCGVVKVQVRDRSLGMEVMVSGLLPTDSFQREIRVCAEGGGDGNGNGEEMDHELANISIEKGKGTLRFQCEDMEKLHDVGAYQNWTGIRIVLDESREIRGIWKTERAAHKAAEGSEIEGEIYAAERLEIAEKTDDGTNNQAVAIAENIQKVKNIERIDIAEKTDNIDKEDDIEKTENVEEAVNQQSKTQTKVKGRQEKQVHRALAEDKWEQLWAIYPHISPFRDKREYLSISPADFVIFSVDSYKTINNSFLLHGFYNYHHLILTQMEKKGEKIYYVGVPGNYFEREKQVAIMFGFESFECEEEPAQAGDFGYYMIRAQL